MQTGWMKFRSFSKEMEHQSFDMNKNSEELRRLVTEMYLIRAMCNFLTNDCNNERIRFTFEFGFFHGIMAAAIIFLWRKSNRGLFRPIFLV